MMMQFSAGTACDDESVFPLPVHCADGAAPRRTAPHRSVYQHHPASAAAAAAAAAAADVIDVAMLCFNLPSVVL